MTARCQVGVDYVTHLGRTLNIGCAAGMTKTKICFPERFFCVSSVIILGTAEEKKKENDLKVFSLHPYQFLLYSQKHHQ